MRVAIVCDGIWVYGGAERVLECMLRIYPNADVFALVDLLPADARGWLGNRSIRTSFLQTLPFTARYFRMLLSLWPIAMEQFDLAGYDLVISSHFAVAHGALTGPSQVHVAYTHSPMRYAWDLQAEYLREARLDAGPKTLLVRPMLHRLRMWDAAAAMRVDSFSANSSFVARRIKKYYRRDSTVIYPPVFLDRFTFRANKEDYYLYLGRLVAYKRVDLIIDAFAAMPDRKLVVAGDGPLLKSLRERATPNVKVIGAVDAARANALMGGARACVHVAVEDFGIALVEAQAAGTPVIGLGVGGLQETVRDLSHAHPSGLLFTEQSVEALRDAVDAFEGIRTQLNPADCYANAVRFAPENFCANFTTFVQRTLDERGATPAKSPGALMNAAE